MKTIEQREAEIEESFKAFDVTQLTVSGSLNIHWSIKGIGFGSTGIESDDENIMIYNECMSKQFLKKLLCKLVDDAVLDLEPMNENLTKSIKLDTM